MSGKLIKIFMALSLVALIWLLSSQRSLDMVLATNDVAPRTASEQQVIDVYSTAKRAVVNVSTRSIARNIFGPISREGAGSGFIIDGKEGYVLTNAHVIEGAKEAEIFLASGDSFAVSLIGADSDTDLALLKIVDPPEDLVALELGNSSALEVGQRVLAIGNPFGLARTLTTGIISSLGRAIQADSGRMIEDLVQTDAAINPGNSGGPLLDTAGRVIGINTAILSNSGQSAGIGLAIPSTTVKRVVVDFLKYGRVRKPKLGVFLQDTDFGTAILYVQPGSPADKAGLKGALKQDKRGQRWLNLSESDFIVGVDGKKVVGKGEIQNLLYRVDEGELLSLSVRRGLRVPSFRKVEVKPELK